MSERIAILGVGLIGGSIALGLKERTDHYVIGYDIAIENLDHAKRIGAIDQIARSLEEAVEQATIIVIALPVSLICETIEKLAQLSLASHTIVTDVGSTKQQIMQYGQQLIDQGVSFIGGHPMAGSHRSGMQAADSLLFENAYYILTPPTQIPLADVQRLSHLLEKATHAQLVIMDALFHDRIVGAVSHLPHIIAAGLVVQVGQYNDQNEWFHRLAAGGFRDLTRIGASHPQMWRDILMSNRNEVVQLLYDWEEQMRSFRHALENQDANWIEETFATSKKLRETLPDRNTHLIPQIFECYVDVPDHPGAIGQVALLLGEHGINLSNLAVMENREEALGVLRLSFKEEEHLRQAIRCLSDAGYPVYDEALSHI
ncbi:prephenate dehydrogenase [Seinonella peptonophila]|uniref:Prephenate dehydrogenase n=1 Tax=Seinonella peptonophila TaxID=112248 RepID=A0A1M4TEK9_9BACL|nr:prephenate dehydrogenase [Seinonella peptonophila]SHE42930.1 prephenate dehydrogenase [Seinonella peptonophila]